MLRRPLVRGSQAYPNRQARIAALALQLAALNPDPERPETFVSCVDPTTILGRNVRGVDVDEFVLHLAPPHEVGNGPPCGVRALGYT